MSLIVPSDRREVIVFFIDMDKSMRNTDLAFPSTTPSHHPSVLKDRFEVLRQALKCFIQQKASTLASPGMLWYSLCGVWDDMMELLPVSSSSSGDIDFAIDQYLSKNILLEYAHTHPISITSVCEFLEDTADRFMASHSANGRMTAVRGILFCSRDVPLAAAAAVTSSSMRLRHKQVAARILLDVIPLRPEIPLVAGAPSTSVMLESQPQMSQDEFEVLFVDGSELNRTPGLGDQSTSAHPPSAILSRNKTAEEPASTIADVPLAGEWDIVREMCTSRGISCLVSDVRKPSVLQHAVGSCAGVGIGIALMNALSIYHHFRPQNPAKVMSLKKVASSTPPPSNLSPRVPPARETTSSGFGSSTTSPTRQQSPSHVRAQQHEHRDPLVPRVGGGDSAIRHEVVQLHEVLSPSALASTRERPTVIGRAVAPSELVLEGAAVAVGVVTGTAQPAAVVISATVVAAPPVGAVISTTSPPHEETREVAEVGAAGGGGGASEVDDEEVPPPPVLDSTQSNRTR